VSFLTSKESYFQEYSIPSSLFSQKPFGCRNYWWNPRQKLKSAYIKIHRISGV
jgi:hypothetical protein